MPKPLGPKYIYAQEHKLYYYCIISLKGIEKLKTETNYYKTVWGLVHSVSFETPPACTTFCINSF